MIKLPMVNSKWSSTDGVKFTVQEIFEKDGEAWIRYTKDTDGSEYTCIVDAFIPRFMELPT